MIIWGYWVGVSTSSRFLEVLKKPSIMTWLGLLNYWIIFLKMNNCWINFTFFKMKPACESMSSLEPFIITMVNIPEIPVRIRDCIKGLKLWWNSDWNCNCNSKLWRHSSYSGTTVDERQGTWLKFIWNCVPQRSCTAVPE